MNRIALLSSLCIVLNIALLFQLQAQDRIIGGQNAAIADYPYQAAMIEPAPSTGQVCGASILSANWVVTAAHCMYDEFGNLLGPNDQRIWVGIDDLFSNGGQIINVAQVVIHPSYNPNFDDNDIALLRLTNPINFSDPNLTAEPISIVTQADAQAGLTDPGVVGWVSGWGDTTTTNGPPWSTPNLQAVDVPIVSNAAANAPNVYNGDVTSNMLAAGYLNTGGKDACQGDSGGPFVVPDGSGGWKLAGIVSWGDGCAEPNAPGVYARVSVYESWINTVTGAAVGIDQADEIEVAIYPNPATDYLAIQLEGDAQVTLTDIQGRNVVQTSTTGYLQLDLTNLSSGYYNLNIQTEEGVANKKILVQ